MSTKLFQLEGRKEKEWICFQELNSTLKYDWNYPTFPSNINSLLATHKNVPFSPLSQNMWQMLGFTLFGLLFWGKALFC